MRDLRVVVQMLIRNEDDIIYETLSEITRWGLSQIVILDGDSQDATVSEIRRFEKSHPEVELRLISEADPRGEFHDHLRNRLLALTLEWQPDWIISLDADEIYHTSPLAAIQVAADEGANVVRNVVPQFWITLADMRSILTEDRYFSIQQRRRWYSWGHMGTFMWKVQPEHFYPAETPKRTPELPGQTWRDWQIAGSMLPICKHYCFRTLEQAVQRMRERQTRGGRKYFGKYFENWIIDQAAVGLAHFDETWDTRNTHTRVQQYMGGT